MQDERIQSPMSPSASSSEALSVNERQNAGQDVVKPIEQSTERADEEAEQIRRPVVDATAAAAARRQVALGSLQDAGKVGAITPRAARASSAASDTEHTAAGQALDSEIAQSSPTGLPVASTISQLPTATAPEGEIPVPVGNPYRRPNSRHAKTKGILKPPPPPPAKFSFKRDVLGYVVGDASGLPSLNGLGQIASVSSSPSLPDSQATPTNPSETISSSLPPLHGSNGPNTLHMQAHPPGRVEQPASRTGGGLWRRLGGAVTAVAGSVPVPQSAVKTLNSLSASVRSPILSDPQGSGAPVTNQGTHGSVQGQDQEALKAEYVKSVRFTMSSLSVVYPINGPGPPGTEALTRKRINQEYVANQAIRSKEGGWTTLDLLDLYEDCCRTREEPGIAALRTLLMSTSSPPKVIDLRDTNLTRGSAAVLSDILSVDFGLRKLVLDNCNLDDESVKPIIHALLISGTLPSLSIANNKRIRSKGWRMIAYYMRRSSALKYLDVSENTIDKKIADLFNEALVPPKYSPAIRQDTPSVDRIQPISPQRPPPEHGENGDFEDGSAGADRDEPDPFINRRAPLLLSRIPSSSGLTSLRLENCSLRNPVLEALANTIRHSRVKHVSLRRNRINQMGAVALAVLIRDYELSPGTSAPTNGSITEQLSISDTGSQGIAHSLRQLSSPTAEQGAFRPYGPSFGNSMTAGLSQHGPLTNPQNWTPARAGTPEQSEMLSPSSSSSYSASDVDDHETSFGPERNRGRVSVSAREASRYADMRARLHKQIETLPRVGHLLTLDIRSNEIKGGVTYISQVLKRNRTLRVLNLSDNRIEAPGLLALAEALKYNTTLETLDLSNNPCCGPSLEGIRALRTALVLNNSLMRVFLNNTGFDTSGAIALAEYLPDFQSLIHLDLTENPDLSIAGVMALAAAIKLNHTLRCLDLSIPTNDADFARLSQDILQSCVKNTELAQMKSAARGARGEVATPIYKSELAKDLKEFETNSSRAFNFDFADTLRPTVDSIRHCIQVFTTTLPRDEDLLRKGEPVQGRFTVQGICHQAAAAQHHLLEQMRTMSAGRERDALGAITAHMAVLLQRAAHVYDFDAEEGPDRTLHLLTADLPSSTHLSPHSPIRSPASPSQPISSPSFSITDSDGSDCESSVDEEQDYLSQGQNPSGLTVFDSPLERSGSTQSNSRPPKSLDVLETDQKQQSSLTAPRSPVESHSRNLTLEEGEVFRRGSSKIGEGDETTLLDVLDRQSDIAGEELKQEILETEVERPRRSSISLSDPDDHRVDVTEMSS